MTGDWLRQCNNSKNNFHVVVPKTYLRPPHLLHAILHTIVLHAIKVRLYYTWSIGVVRKPYLIHEDGVM